MRQSASLSQDHEKAEKKDGLGVFAKLLAGLLQKNSKPGAESAASGTGIPGIGERQGKSRPGGAAEVPSGAEDAGGKAAGLHSLRVGKTRGASPLRDGGTTEEAAKTDPLSGRGKTRAKSLSPDGTDADDVAVVALARPAVPKAGKALGGGAVEGEKVTAAGERLGHLVPDGTPEGGKEIPDAAVPPDGDAAVSALAETADQDLPVGELSRYIAEDLPAGTPGPGGNARSSVRGTTEKDGRSGSPEARIRDRRRERSDPEAGNVRAGLDKRDGAESLRFLAGAGKGEDGGGETERNSMERSSTELIVELRSMGKTQAEISVERENRPVQSFQNMLARELHENLNGDIVRHASVMLRDGGEGTIRLSLRPETLGSVKIRLEITENKIAGHIIVESDEAFKAFEQELHSLEQSFRDSGFDGASFEMAFASGGREDRREAEGEADEADGLFSGRLAALHYDAAATVVSENADESQWMGIRPDSRGRPLVNMLV
jgi:hypothetical protein